MPEFAEVHFQIRYLRERCIDWQTERFGLTGRCELFQNIAAPERSQAVHDFFTDCQIQEIYQRGKHIVFVTSTGVMTSHLMYRGRWSFTSEPFVSHYKHHAKPPTEQTMSFWLMDQHKRRLCFYDPQNQAKLQIYPGVTDLKLIRELAILGPEVMRTSFSAPGFETVTLTMLQKTAKASRRPIGNFLLDQHKIAGLGRTYVQKILDTVQIEAKCPASSLSDNELLRLYNTMINTADTAIRTLSINHQEETLCKTKL